MSQDSASPPSPDHPPARPDSAVPPRSGLAPENRSSGPCARSFERAHWEWTFDQARDAGRAFSCAVMVIDNVDGIEAAQRDDWVRGFFVDLERLIDERKEERRVLFGVEDARAYLALLDCDAHEAGRFAGEIIRATYPLTGFLPSPKPGLSVGIASTRYGDEPPDRNLFLETLLRVASEGAEVAVAGGGGRWVHTELYGLVQRRLEERAGGTARSGESGASSTPRPQVDLAHEQNGGALPSEDGRRAQETSQAAPDQNGREVEPPADSADQGDVESKAWPARASVTDLEPEKNLPRPGDVGTTVSSPDSEEAEAGWREIQPRRRPSGAWIPVASARRQPGAALDEPLPPAGGGLMDLLLAALGQAGLTRAEAASAERVLLPILSDYVEEERARTQQQSQSRVQLLERRIQKLRAQLESVERAKPEPQVGEDGLASTFRAVQGLSRADQQYDLKSSLLEAILHANLELAACSARRP